jgi:hypothetical protein
VAQDIVTEDPPSIFGKTVEGDDHISGVKLTLGLEDPAVEDGPNMVNSILYGFQVEKKKAF